MSEVHFPIHMSWIHLYRFTCQGSTSLSTCHGSTYRFTCQGSTSLSTCHGSTSLSTLYLSRIHFPIHVSLIPFPIHMSGIHFPHPSNRGPPLPLLYIRTLYNHCTFPRTLPCPSQELVQSIISYDFTRINTKR